MKIGSSLDHGQNDATADYWLGVLRPRLAEVDKFKGHLRRRKALERESEAMRTALAAIHACYNALSPICHFPPEILSRIFSFSAINEPLCSKEWLRPSATSSALGWMKVTHVCSYWREAALQEPNLWTNVTYRLGRRWGGFMLARSKAVPISVSVGYRERFNKNLSEHFFHIFHLDINAFSGSLRREVASWITPATLLESLELSSYSGFVSLPTHAFGGYAPLLHKIVFRNVYLPYDSLGFANLTHLELKWPCKDVAHFEFREAPELSDLSGHRMDHLLGSLARMSALRTLILDNCLPPPAPDISLEFSIQLRHLDLLKLTGTTAQCGVFMDHVDFPPTCTLCLELIHNESELLSAQNTLRGLRAHFSDRTNTLCHTQVAVSFLCISNESYIIAWLHDDHCPTYETTNYVPTPKGEATIQIGQRTEIHSLQDICNALPLQELRVIRKTNNTDSRSPWTATQWLATFGNCRAVEHVIVDEQNLLNFSGFFFNLAPIEAETEIVDSPGDLQKAPMQDQVPFPNLQSLSLRDLKFYERYEGDHRIHYFLAKWLRIRQSVAALPRLVILDSWIRADQVEILEGLVKVNIVGSKVHDWGDLSRDEYEDSEEESDDDEHEHTDSEGNEEEDASEYGGGSNGSNDE